MTGVLGCGGDASSDGTGSASSDDSAGGSLNVLFSPMYSAYDGVHEFKLPAVIDGVSGARWSADPVDAVSLETTSDGVMITMKRAGTVTITAQAGNLKGTSTLSITQATPAEWEAGSGRYNNGGALRASRDAGTGGGFSDQAACASCHGETASYADVRHTPQQTGGYSDAELITIFTMGQKPSGVAQRVMPIEEWSRIHTWEMTDDEKKGVVVYLRSLEPKAQDGYNFGVPGRGPGGDGGVRPRRDGGIDALDAGTSDAGG
ncbi:MAG: hypothetical protein ABW252_10810 [Polyangiales bacterium]